MDEKPKYWVACSGGVDSVVLCHLLHEQGIRFGILHCNFHLREAASNVDEAFVRELAKKLEAPIRVKEFQTEEYAVEHGFNTQLAARELRYNWFDEVIESEAVTILIAQHFDDQMETFFLQLRRGGGVKGLSGIPFYKRGYLRPLLKYTKEEILSLAKKKSWTWREDKTNALNDYKRNWYRNEVLSWLNNLGFPLEEVVPLMHDFQKMLRFLDALPIPNEVSISDWLSFPIWYRQIILDKQDLGVYSEKEITKLTDAKKGKFIGTAEIKVWNEGDTLVFVRKDVNSPEKKLHQELLSPEDVVFNSDDLFIDASKTVGTLSFRKWQSGDKFRPLGMKGEKAMGKFLRDRKVPSHQKEDVLVLTDESNRILGVFGFGVNENYKVSAQTQAVIVVSLRY